MNKYELNKQELQATLLHIVSCGKEGTTLLYNKRTKNYHVCYKNLRVDVSFGKYTGRKAEKVFVSPKDVALYEAIKELIKQSFKYQVKS